MNSEQARALIRLLSTVYAVKSVIQKIIPAPVLEAIQEQARTDVEAMRQTYPEEDEFAKELMKRMSIILEPFVPSASPSERLEPKESGRKDPPNMAPMPADEFVGLLETLEGDGEARAAAHIVALDMLAGGFMAKAVPDAQRRLAQFIAPDIACLERRRRCLTVDGIEAIEGRLSAAQHLIIAGGLTLAEAALREMQIIAHSYRNRCSALLGMPVVRGDLTDWTQGVLKWMFEGSTDPAELLGAFTKLATAIMAGARKHFCSHTNA